LAAGRLRAGSQSAAKWLTPGRPSSVLARQDAEAVSGHRRSVLTAAAPLVVTSRLRSLGPSPVRARGSPPAAS